MIQIDVQVLKLRQHLVSKAQLFMALHGLKNVSHQYIAET